MQPYRLSEGQKARLLARLAMAWDGQWFLKACETYGWEAAAQLNARVRHAFGRIEMRLLLRTLGKPRADNLADVAQLLQTYFAEVLRAGFQGAFQVEGESLHLRVTECAALAGARRAGLERHDQACVGCPDLFRIYLETLLPGQAVQVEVLEQMGYGADQCRYVMRVR